MKYSALVLIAAVLVTACKPTVPSVYIQPGDMEDLLYDYHVGQAIAKEGRDGRAFDFERSKYFHAVLKKHGVTEADFDSSLVYYYSHMDRLKSIYTEVNKRLSDDAKALGASVGVISRYSQYSTTGDTANIWTGNSDVLLIPRPFMNRYDFTVKADTSFYKGDSFMFQFMSQTILQGRKDAVVCILSKYEGDSTVQTVNFLNAEGLVQVNIPANRERLLKEMQGYIYMGNGGENGDLRKMLFISQIQLIRFHNKNLKNEEKADSVKTDSLQRADQSGGPKPDTLRNTGRGRLRGRIFSAKP